MASSLPLSSAAGAAASVGLMAALGPAGIIPLAATLIGSGVSVGQAINASKKQKEAAAAADEAIARLKAMRYEDTMAGLQVPMMGFEQAAQKQAQREAMQIQALQEAGGAAVLGGTPGLAAMGAEEDLARMAQIDQMEYARNLERARNQQQIANLNLGMQAGIAEMELGGAQQAAAQAETMKQQALTSAGQTISQGGIDIYKNSLLYKPQVGDQSQKTVPGYSPNTYGPRTEYETFAPAGTVSTATASYAPGYAMPMSPITSGVQAPQAMQYSFSAPQAITAGPLRETNLAEQANMMTVQGLQSRGLQTPMQQFAPLAFPGGLAMPRVQYNQGAPAYGIPGIENSFYNPF